MSKSNDAIRRSGRLSKASPYEQRFGTRRRPVGRPAGDVQPLFATVANEAAGVDPVILAVAKRRAYAVVHDEQRERLQEVFAAELKVLRRRGAEEVAEDAGIRPRGQAVEENSSDRAGRAGRADSEAE